MADITEDTHVDKADAWDTISKKNVEIERLRDALRWIGNRANTQLLSEQLDAPRRDHVEMAYDMNACARAALAKTNAW